VYGHPNPDVLERLEAVNSGVYHTELDGEVRVLLKSGAYRIETKLTQERRISDK
jgi:competence protein ComEC